MASIEENRVSRSYKVKADGSLPLFSSGYTFHRRVIKSVTEKTKIYHSNLPIFPAQEGAQLTHGHATQPLLWSPPKLTIPDVAVAGGTAFLDRLTSGSDANFADPLKPPNSDFGL